MNRLKVKGAKPTTWLLFLALCAATLFRLLLNEAMMLYFIPGTQYDDLMQVLKAMSIADGYWLGDYGALTLVKGTGYPLMTAIFIWLGIPNILGYHLLYVAACLVFVAAVRPVVKKRWMLALGYLFMLFNPIAFSAQITRLYRDIAYYSMALLCIAAALGFMLRYNAFRRALWYGGISGFSLALAANTREDSQWLYVYVAACLVAFVVLRLVHSRKKRGKVRWKRLAAPLALLLVMVVGFAFYAVPVSGANYAYYGTFTTDEYNNGAFAEAYGALSRLNGDAEDPHVVIPEAQRRQLYELSPSFAELKEVLDGENSPFAEWKEVQGEYRTGYFSFILREAAAAIGKFSTPARANDYFTRLAKEVNEICDSGQMEAGPRRSTIAARYYPWMLPEIAKATADGMWLTLGCHGISPMPVPVAADDAYLVKFEDYVNDTIAADRYMENGEIVANYNYTGWQLNLQWVVRAIVSAYRLVLRWLFLAAVAMFVAAPVILIIKKRSNLGFWAAWVAAASLLCAFVARSVMIAFVHVSSFWAIDNPAYQAASYPVALGFIVLAAAVGQQAVLLLKKKVNPASAVLKEDFKAI